MPDSRTAATRTADARRREVAQLVSGGYSPGEMVAKLSEAGFGKVSRPTVYRDIGILKKEWHEANVGLVEDQRARHVQRLDADLAYWTRQIFTMTGDDAAERGAKLYADVVLPLLKERAKIMGLQVPARRDITDYLLNWARDNGHDPDMVLKMVSDVVESTGF